MQGFDQRTALLEKRLAMQDELVSQLKQALSAKPDITVWKPIELVVYEDENVTPAAIALCALLCELGVDYTKELRCTDGPVLSDDGLLFWDVPAAVIHVANASGIPSWYPTDTEARTRCHEALFLYQKWLSPLLVNTILNPAMDWCDQVSDDERSKAYAELRQVVWPKIAAFVERSGGPTLGGAYPCIGDLLVGIVLICAQLRLPLLDIWSDKVISQYTKVLKVKLKHWGDYMDRHEVLFGGFCLQAQYPDGHQMLEFTKDATISELVSKLSEVSAIPEADLAIKCGGGILGCPALVLTGEPGCKLEDGTVCLFSYFAFSHTAFMSRTSAWNCELGCFCQVVLQS